MSYFSYVLHSLPFLDTWDESKVNDQSGRVFIVTGGTDGLGLETAKTLARKNAHVYITSRTGEKGQRVLESLKKELPDAKIELLVVDLSSFSSIKRAAATFAEKNVPLHGLINNAGVGAPKGKVGSETEEGIEVTLATNYYGPFYFTLKLLPLLKESARLAPARIVWNSSGLQALGKVNWEDLRGVRHNQTGLFAYGTSKLMDLMAAKEMARRFEPYNIRVFAVHPGVTNSGIYSKNDPTLSFSYVLSWMNYLIGQPTKRGARPLLYAATAPELDDPKKNGAFIGGILATNLWQTVERSPFNSQGRNPAAAKRLFDETITLLKSAANDPELQAV